MTLEISRPWMCAATTLPDTGAGFFTAVNNGTEPDRLIAASTATAEAVEIHAIKVVGPDVRMRPVENGLGFPAGTTITLKPRGYHLLMKGLKGPLVQGSKVAVVLTFEKAGMRTVEMTVEAPALVGEDTLNESLKSKAAR
jgi:copper(I)-binding protein